MVFKGLKSNEQKILENIWRNTDFLILEGSQDITEIVK